MHERPVNIMLKQKSKVVILNIQIVCIWYGSSYFFIYINIAICWDERVLYQDITRKILDTIYYYWINCK